MARYNLHKLLQALGFALVLTGCSTSFTYNQLDWLIPWYMDDYVNLSRDQKQVLKVKLEPLLQWHRHEELDRYISLLDHIEQDLQTKVNRDVVQGWFDEVYQAASRVELSLLSMSLELGETMSDEQLSEFTDSLWERQRELQKKYLERSDEEYSRDNYRSLLKNLRRFTGKLASEQEQRLQEAAASLKRFDTAWLQDREQWLRKLEPLLQRNPGWQEAILNAHSKRQQERSPEYQEYVNYNMLVISDAIADVMNQLDEKQQARMLAEIGKLRVDLQKLSKKPGAI